ncbi:AraC family transcriptional regulator [Burkholderia ubonensis]|uniref:AraC family transcriptional regulator n=1 Tax=Burkholderia ubonensis TaxID=101571 RepID=UPI0009B42D23|nr:AraC family transcriptional regulator [Burkholderia ubonensis]
MVVLELENTLSERWIEYDTSAQKLADRIKCWNDHISATLCPSETTISTPISEFHAKLTEMNVGFLKIYHWESTPAHCTRSAHLARVAPNEDLFLKLITFGQATLHQNHQTQTVCAGDLAIYDGSKPFNWDITDRTKAKILRIPRHLLENRASGLEQMIAQHSPTNWALSSLVGEIFSCASHLYKISDFAKLNRATHGIIEIISAALEINLPRERVAAASQIDMRSRVKKYICDNLDNPQLSVELLAKHFSVSPRTLHRMFAVDKKTLMRWVCEQRLILAHTLLCDGRASSVSQAAMESGFNDFSHFSRAFKRYHNVNPSALIKKKNGGS